MLGQNFHQVFGDLDGALAAVLGWADVHAAAVDQLSLPPNLDLAALRAKAVAMQPFCTDCQRPHTKANPLTLDHSPRWQKSQPESG
jgi:hypothetical protein